MTKEELEKEAEDIIYGMGYDTYESDGQWDDSNSCKMCCWYYDNKFEIGD